MVGVQIPADSADAVGHGGAVRRQGGGGQRQDQRQGADESSSSYKSFLSLLGQTPMRSPLFLLYTQCAVGSIFKEISEKIF